MEVRLHLFQARGLPGAPSSLATLSLMGSTARSAVAFECSRPSWNETLSLRLYSLAPDAAPDAVLTLRAEHGAPPLGMLRFRLRDACQLDYSNGASPPLPEPAWLTLRPSSAGGAAAEVLLLLELVMLDNPTQKIRPPPLLRPSTQRAYVQVAIIQCFLTPLASRHQKYKSIPFSVHPLCTCEMAAQTPRPGPPGPLLATQRSAAPPSSRFPQFDHPFLSPPARIYAHPATFSRS
jgi:hypothetical protein